MSGPLGIPSFLLSLPTTAADVFAVRPGQTIQTQVQGQAPNLFISVAGTKVPLDAAKGLVAGQPVTVTATAGERGLQLQVQPTVVPQAAPTSNMSELPKLVAGALRTLGALNHAEEAPRLVPSGLPPTPAALRTLLSLFTERGQTGRDLQTLAATVSRASQSGALPADVADDFAWLASQVVASNEKDIPKALRHAGRQAGRPIEARLATALRQGGLGNLAEVLRDDLRGQLGRLLEDKGLAEFLKAEGGLHEFREGATRVMERLAGSDLQNLHGLNEPYVYLELPFSPDAPVRHAQIHVFGRSDGRHGIDADHAQAVLDLSTTAMGDLWISLMTAPGHCQCTIRTTDPEAVGVLEGTSGDLVEALSGAGYAGASVRVSLWDGNRVREAAALMRGMAGVDFKA